jgi:hypothetical protein
VECKFSQAYWQAGGFAIACCDNSRWL